MLHGKQQQPDVRRFLTAVRRGVPDRVPACEIHVDTEIKELFLGRRIAILADDVDFWRAAGYDYVFVSTAGQRIADHLSTELLAGPHRDKAHEHRWATSGLGAITGWEAFENFPWVAGAQVDYSSVDGLRTLLPDGMLAVANI